MAQAMTSPKGSDNSKVRTIGVVAFDGVELIDLTGPLDVFAMANEGFRRGGITDGPAYKLTVIAKRQGLVITSSGLQVNADNAYENVSDGIDTLVIPGSPSVSAVLADPELQICPIHPSLCSSLIRSKKWPQTPFPRDDFYSRTAS